MSLFKRVVMLMCMTLLVMIGCQCLVIDPTGVEHGKIKRRRQRKWEPLPHVEEKLPEGQQALPLAAPSGRYIFKQTGYIGRINAMLPGETIVFPWPGYSTIESWHGSVASRASATYGKGMTITKRVENEIHLTRLKAAETTAVS